MMKKYFRTPFRLSPEEPTTEEPRIILSNHCKTVGTWKYAVVKSSLTREIEKLRLQLYEQKLRSGIITLNNGRI